MRPLVKKPGPKSKTRRTRTKKTPKNYLGDTDTEQSVADENFRSPSPDENLTNYDLEYTHQGPSSVRKSPKKQKSPKAAAASDKNVTASTSRINTNITTTSPSKRAAPNAEQTKERRGTAASVKDATASTSRNITTISPSKRTAPHAEQTKEKRGTASSVKDATASTSRNIRNITTTSLSKRAARDTEQTKERKKRRKQQFPKRLEWKKIFESTNFMIPRAPFARVVREIMFRECIEVTMITREALEALQTATEKYMELRFEDAYLITLHSGRKTLHVRDLELLNFLLSRFNLN